MSKTNADESRVDSSEIVKAILVARDRTVLLDSDLAALYGVTTKALNQAVKRNVARFPADFAFRLSPQETIAMNKLDRQSGSQKHRDPRSPPFAFTEHGAMMLAMVLRSARAIEMSVYVVRAFASLREAIRTNAQLVKHFQNLEERVDKHDADIVEILAAIRELVAPPKRSARSIGFLADIK